MAELEFVCIYFVFLAVAIDILLPEDFLLVYFWNLFNTRENDIIEPVLDRF